MPPSLLPADLPTDDVTTADVEAFVEKWSEAQAAEIANAQSFLLDLCDLLGVPTPDPATKDPAKDAYVFERPVVFQDGTTTSAGRIDLYKRGCFVLETKQGVDAERKRRGKTRSTGHGTRGSAAWERAMKAAKGQAARYARNLDIPAGHGSDGLHTEPIPPLVIAVDVGYCFDLYANFGHPQRYNAFPDQRGYRIPLADLHRAEARATLRLAFTDPHALDPTRRQAQVTRKLAATLARLASDLEAQGHAPDAVFGFLTRCLFTMFAEDTALIPDGSFTDLLREYREHLDVLPDALEALWATMDTGGFSPALKARVRRFNGSLFSRKGPPTSPPIAPGHVPSLNGEEVVPLQGGQPRSDSDEAGGPMALPLTAEQLDLLLDASTSDWRNVEPAIFGTLLERALDPRERHKLGAHYTPRAYVERLVMPTVIDPLREEWDAVQVAVARIEEEREDQSFDTDAARQRAQREARREIVETLRGFLRRLTSVRVLDPACGSGNFLYVTLEHLKRLEAEVLEVMRRYGEQVLEMEQAAVTPAQLLGIEVNPRAAAIADLVLWIGYLQWHLRTFGDPQNLPEPILRAYGNVEHRDAVLASDDRTPRTDDDGEPVTVWDGITTTTHPTTGRAVPDETARRPVYDYADPRPADWPEAEFIVGNPPFVGSKRMRDALGDGYTEALRAAYPDVPDSADLVMYWWHKAAEAVRTGRAERFGFITTNSITQSFNRRVVEHHLDAEPPLALAFAVPDHPWVDDTLGAAVRVAMTVGVPGPVEGVLSIVSSEERGEDHEARAIALDETQGEIFADLAVGVNVAGVEPLQANSDIGHVGIQLNGSGFLLSPDEVSRLEESGDGELIKLYWGGTNLKKAKPRKERVIDTFGLEEDELRERYPATYQHLRDHVKPDRDQTKRKKIRELWWIHGWERPEMRKALEGLDRYIATVETSKHRYFVFLDEGSLANNSVVVLALDDAYHFGVLSSRIHEIWALGAGGRLGVGNDPRYNLTKTFQPFPFPAATDAQKDEIRRIAESLDDIRASRIAQQPALTMTGLYNVLQKLRAGEPLSDKEQKVYQSGFVGILREHHDQLDRAVAAAYGWDDLSTGSRQASSPDFPVQEVLRRIVALNAARQAEEAAGRVRWLRPSFQAPDAAPQADLGMEVAPVEAATAKREPEPWPSSLPERARAVRRVLQEAAAPATVEAVARAFHNARRRDVADLLDTLVELGQARPTEDGAYAV